MCQYVSFCRIPKRIAITDKPTGRRNTLLVHPHRTSATNEGSSTFQLAPRLTTLPPERTFVRNIHLSSDAESLVEQDCEEKRREFWIDGNKEKERIETTRKKKRHTIVLEGRKRKRIQKGGGVFLRGISRNLKGEFQ